MQQPTEKPLKVYTKNYCQARINVGRVNLTATMLSKVEPSVHLIINTNLTFDGNISFTNNGHNTEYGGGMYLTGSSTFSILPNTTMFWKNNRATRGGAIYVDDNPIN